PPGVEQPNNFFTSSMPNKKRDGRKTGARKANANASATFDSQGNGAEEDGAEQVMTENDVEDCTASRDNVIVEQMTKNMAKMLDDKLATILKPVTDLSEKFDNIIERMTTLEQRVSDLEDGSARSAPRMESVEKALQKALERLDNHENQSRRQNIRVIGLKEGVEGSDPVVFFEGWIPEILGMQEKRIKIERAHRTGPPSGRDGKRGPRAVLVRLHNFTDKQKILYAARKKGKLQVDGREISFYQDFTADLVKKRQESAAALRRLREAGVKYSFVYPAVIRIFHRNGSVMILCSGFVIKYFFEQGLEDFYLTVAYIYFRLKKKLRLMKSM
uniref:L1 transposable element RRM domain-containing protein n=1 Tax=Oryzias melastigma TaxID=30732 RepID=A0A3B3CLD3_ORYME